MTDDARARRKRDGRHEWKAGVTRETEANNGYEETRLFGSSLLGGLDGGSGGCAKRRGQVSACARHVSVEKGSSRRLTLVEVVVGKDLHLAVANELLGLVLLGTLETDDQRNLEVELLGGEDDTLGNDIATHAVERGWARGGQRLRGR